MSIPSLIAGKRIIFILRSKLRRKEGRTTLSLYIPKWYNHVGYFKEQDICFLTHHNILLVKDTTNCKMFKMSFPSRLHTDTKQNCEQCSLNLYPHSPIR